MKSTESKGLSPASAIKGLVCDVLAQESDFAVWQDKLNALAKLLGDITGVRVDDDMNQSEATLLAGGKAISPVQAAKCINEVLRTRQFWLANLAAIEDFAAKKKQISILYAGTGPYGAIILPLLPLLDQVAIRLVCLDIHEENLQALQKVLQVLEPKLAEIDCVCADATLWQPEKGEQFDLIISETMNAYLHREPQVSIFAHLQQFLAHDGHLIPEEISIDLWLPEYNYYDVSAGKVRKTPEKKIARLMQLDAKLAETIRHKKLEKIEVAVNLPTERPCYRSLLLRTEIKIYKHLGLTREECSLNRDKRFDPPGGINTAEPLCFTYHIMNDPDWTLRCDDWLKMRAQAPEKNEPGRLGISCLYQVWWQAKNIIMNQKHGMTEEENTQVFRLLNLLGIQYGELIELVDKYTPTFAEFEHLLENKLGGIQTTSVTKINEELNATRQMSSLKPPSL